MNDRGPSRPSGYGRGARPAESETFPERQSWTPFQGTSGGPSGFRGGTNTQPMDMDVEEHDPYPAALAAKRLTAHVAPVPGRSASPEVSRRDTRPGPGPRGQQDEDDYIYGPPAAVKSEPNDFRKQSYEQERRYPPNQGSQSGGYPQNQGPPSGGGYDDYRAPYPDRNRQYEQQQQQQRFEPKEDQDIFTPKVVRRPPSPPPFRPDNSYRGGPEARGPVPRFAAESNDIDAGRRKARAPIEQDNKNFSKTAYPARGMPQPSRSEPDPKNRPAVYEMSKIPKKARDPDEIEETEEAKVMRLRSEHAKKDMQINQLRLLVERTIEKENDLKRLNKGRALADNKEFCDNKKLQMDADKKLKLAQKAMVEIDITLNAILDAQKRAEKAEMGDNSQDGETSTAASSKQNKIISTDFLGCEREDKEEEVDGINKIEYFDGGDYWCEPCQDVFSETVKSFLEHLHSEEHWKNVPANKAPWPITRRNQDFDPDRQLAPLKGNQFIVPCKGFYCAICRIFLGDNESAEEHLFSTNHNRLYTRFLISKPEYDHINNRDKGTARAKSVAKIRQKKREVEEKRQKDEEEKRKKLEDDKKKKDKEARDKALDETKYTKMVQEKNRMKDLEKIKGRSRDRSRERSREKTSSSSNKRRNVSSSSSSSSSRDSSPDMLTKLKDDIKLKKKCIVSIPREEMVRAQKVYGKLALSRSTSGPTPGSSRSKPDSDSVPSNSRSDSRDVISLTGDKDDDRSRCSTPSTLGGMDDQEGGSKPKKSKLSADFDDDDDEKNNFTLSSVLPVSALMSDDNAVNSPDSAGVIKNPVGSSSSGDPPKSQEVQSSTSPSKKAAAPDFDAIFHSLENDDEDENPPTSTVTSVQNDTVTSSPIKMSSPTKATSDQVITGKDVKLSSSDPALATQSEATEARKETEDYVSSGHSFPQLNLDDLTKSPSYDDV